MEGKFGLFEDDAALALHALGWIVSDEPRAERLLAMTGLDPDDLPVTQPQRNYDSNVEPGAKRWRDVWGAGQGVGAIKAVEPVADVVTRLAQQYVQARQRLAGLP